jgi:hypothetical protein
MQVKTANPSKPHDVPEAKDIIHRECQVCFSAEFRLRKIGGLLVYAKNGGDAFAVNRLNAVVYRAGQRDKRDFRLLCPPGDSDHGFAAEALAVDLTNK